MSIDVRRKVSAKQGRLSRFHKPGHRTPATGTKLALPFSATLVVACHRWRQATRRPEGAFKPTADLSHRLCWL